MDFALPSYSFIGSYWGVILPAAFSAFNFDYRVVVLSDCVARMYGDDLHVLGLQNISRCLGWVITNRQLFEKLKETGHASQP